MDRRLVWGWTLLLVVVVLCFLIPLTWPIWVARHKVVHVVLLAGGDNVEGYAHLDHLAQFLKKLQRNSTIYKRFQHLKNTTTTTTTTTMDDDDDDDDDDDGGGTEGNWSSRDDVFIFKEGKQRHGPWTVGPANIWDYGARPGLFGPDVELSHVLGEAFDDPVVIVKAGYTDRTLYKDWKSPGRNKHNTLDMGFAWVHTLHNIKYALQQVGHVLGPSYKKHRTQLVGLVWWHDYNDVLIYEALTGYKHNLPILLRDFRDALKRPHLPIIVAVAGAAGADASSYAYEPTLREAQESACLEPDLAEHTVCVQTHRYVHPDEMPHLEPTKRYYGHGDTMIEIGGVLANALIELYYKQYENVQLKAEVEADYNLYKDQKEFNFTLVLLAAVAVALVALAAVQGRCGTRRTCIWNRNRLFGFSLLRPKEELEEDRPDDPGDREMTSRFRAGRHSRSNHKGGPRQTKELEPLQPANDSALVELDEVSSSEEETDERQIS